MLQIDKILTVYVDNYEEFEMLGDALSIDISDKNKIAIDKDEISTCPFIKGLLIGIGFSLKEISEAFKNKQLDYINFEHWN